jgi:hypothetical protein
MHWVSRLRVITNSTWSVQALANVEFDVTAQGIFEFSICAASRPQSSLPFHFQHWRYCGMK